jgi:hypothetical protein
MDKQVARVARSLNMVTALCGFLSGSRRRGLAASSMSTHVLFLYSRNGGAKRRSEANTHGHLM